MNWLNINTTHMRDPLWVKSDATQRGAWLSMLGYCTERETNGIIVGARLWTDRQWIHSTGLMAAEVGDSSLWKWVADDLHLELYPHEMQSMVVARREGGRKGGQAKTEAKANASQINGKPKLNPSLTQADPKLNPSLSQPKGNSKGNSKGKSNSKEEEQLEEQVEEELEEQVKVEVKSEAEAEPEAPIPSDATAEPTDAHTALRAVADLGVEYFLSLKADPTFKALDLQLEVGKANAWAQANRRKFTKRFFVNWLNRGLDRAAATNADASLHTAKHPKYGW
jgi:hypothetical protein